MTAPVEVPTRPPAVASSLNTRVVGGLLLVFGTGWMLKQAGVVDMPWTAVVSLVLIALGLALVITARSRATSVPLIVLGGVLTLGLAVGSSNLAISGGIGQRDYAPRIVRSDPRYHLGIGDMVVDLNKLALASGATVIHADVGVGRLEVRVPEGVLVRVDVDTRMGSAEVFGKHLDVHGKARDHYTDPGFDDAQPGVHLFLHVGVGQVVVTR